MEKPKCLGEPSESIMLPPCRRAHGYDMPELGQDIIDAIKWMMTQYDDVRFEYGIAWGDPYAYLVGLVRKE